MHRKGWSSRPQAFNVPFTFDLRTPQGGNGGAGNRETPQGGPNLGRGPRAFYHRVALIWSLPTCSEKLDRGFGLTPPNA